MINPQARGANSTTSGQHGESCLCGMQTQTVQAIEMPDMRSTCRTALLLGDARWLWMLCGMFRRLHGTGTGTSA